MNESEAAIRSFVERLVPPLEGESGGWDAVLRAYQSAPAHRSWRVLRPPTSRRVSLVLGVVLLLGVGLALTALAGVFHGDGVKTGLARFGEWQRGVPGEPAPPDVQSWPDEANKKAPPPLSGPTELRRVLSASVAGVRYDLYGLRSGDTICLRLFATIPPGRYPPPLACTTVQALAAASSAFHRGARGDQRPRVGRCDRCNLARSRDQTTLTCLGPFAPPTSRRPERQADAN